LTKLHNNELP